MSCSYAIPGGSTEVCYEIKKSRFIARVSYVTSREEAMQALQQAKQDYPDARHHCWAYQIGPPHSPSLAAMSDDGEPSGTAGKPILNVIQHKDVGDTMVIVIRYFGGIKLGAGGLVRAYSQSVQQAYEAMSTDLRVELEAYIVQCQFSDEQAIRHWLSKHEGKVTASDYQQAVTLNISLDEQHLAGLKAFLNALKNAAIQTLDD